MPGPGQKNKAKSKSKAKGGRSASQPGVPNTENTATPCMTLDEDEVTRCDSPATQVYPRPERCETHHAQYLKMYKKYKDASKVVDEIAKGGRIPTEDQIAQYCDVPAILEKARYVRKYIEAIRVERIGRDIHGRRFFLKVDDGHKIRIKILTKEMLRAVESLDGLERRAYTLNLEKNPRPDWVEAARVQASAHKILPSAEDVVNNSFNPSNARKTITADAAKHHAAPDEQADLIDLDIRGQKARMLHAFEFLFNPDFAAESMAEHLGIDSKSENILRGSLLFQRILYQYALRIFFYEPNLFAKAEGKVSFKDVILSDEFSLDDAARFAILLERRLDIGLLWMKDSVVEALTISSAGGPANTANIGDPKNRIKMLDGWIYNVTHVKKTSNEAWFTLIQMVEPPANVENRFVRLCNSYDDLISFLSFGALGSVPAPSFCKAEAVTYRNHLSLSGVVIADMISSPKPPEMCIVPSSHPSRKPGHCMWGEVETRGYMFGAIRNEPDGFTDAFLRELKARPDLFHILTRSETDPGQQLEIFGPSSTSQDALPAMRYRMFDAPRGVRRPTGSGEWTVARSARDILFGTNPILLGYLTELNRGASAGWFFHFKKFKVKYIVIIDAVPNRHHQFLAQQVAWAALRAQGYAKGEYNKQKYISASNALFDKCAKERLSWMPAGSWSTNNMI